MFQFPARVQAFALMFLPLLLMACSAARADTPQEAVQRYFAALQDGGPAVVADHMHPADLQRFRDMVMPLFVAEAEAGKDELRKATFGAEATIEQVKAANPSDLMRQFMKLIAGRAASVGVKFEKVEVLGSVAEGEVMHVVTRSRIAAGAVSITKMEVVSVKEDKGNWRILLNGQMEGFAQALRARQGMTKP